jgi:hypothetical protein
VKETLAKYYLIISSPRFHQLLVAFLFQIAQHYGWVDDFVANAFTIFLAGVATIGTIDSAAIKINEGSNVHTHEGSDQDV